MPQSIQIAVVTFIAALTAATGCTPEAGPAYRGNDGRTGEFGASGVTELDQIVWKVRTSAPIAGPAALSNSGAYVVATDGAVIALSLDDGSETWRVELEVSAFGTPVITGNRVLVGTDIGLVAVGLDGTEQWRYEGAPIETAPIIVDAVAYVGDLEGQILAIDVVAGSLIWKAITAGPIRSAPVFVDRSIIVGSGDGGVYSLDPATGEPRWAWNAPAAVRGISASSSRVFVSAGTEVIAVDLDEPEASAWRTDVGGVVETAPSLSGGMVVVGTGRGAMTGLDTTDGSQLFQTTLKAGVHGDIAVTGDRLAVPATARGVEVIDRAGKELWSFRTDGNAVGITPMKNRLYVTDAAGSVYALQ